MNRILTLVTLLLWGTTFLYFYLSGRIASYLHPQFHAYVVAAGAGLLVLGALWWWASRETDTGCGDCGCHHEGEEPRRQLSAGAVFAFGVLLLPLTAAAFISPGQFGEAMVMNRGMVTDVSQLPSAELPGGSWQDTPAWDDSVDSADALLPQDQDEGVEYFTRTPDGAIQVETLDLLFAAEEPALREEFENQRVSIIGQYIPPRGGAEGGFDLVRMFVVCCAADARPLGIKVVGEPVEVPRMGWVRITGVARFEDKGGPVEPRLELEKIEEVEAPRESFLY
ncbi:MAG: TIGR03943 family protein [Chthoniobacterales bacterium]|nr:TIGR03943 family protein [Chthoniobacterales bacterium]